MATKKVRNAPVGWQWRAFIGRETRDGREQPGTAEAIRGGWASTKAEAHRLADAAIAEGGDG